MRKFLKVLRILSAVTLFFFSWTFLPIWQIAAWAAEPPQKTGAGNQKSGGKDQGPGSGSQGPATTGERFEKALEAIRENVSRAGDKADKGEDDAKEREVIKTKRAEIESADSEFRKEFAATEKKLKDAKLPQEILDRHYKFVKHYDDNLKELKTNLDDVEKATTKADRKAKIAEAKAHLEKTKTPSKHVPLDPNKLPNRTRQMKRVQLSWIDQVADWLIPSAEAADMPPTSADLAETLETPQTQEIRDLAQRLGRTSVSLYEYVRNVYTYEPYAGSTKGAIQTIREKTGNEWDQASLLIALYRASGIPCRYVVGSVEIPIDKAINWLGVEDPIMAGTLLLTLGRPTGLVYTGGKVTALRTQHVWVRAYVPFLSSRGATNGSGDMWVDIDPSFKGQTITKTLTASGIPTFDQTSYLLTFRTESPLDFYKSQLQTFLDANNPGYVPEALSPESEITPERFGILIGQVPYIIKSIIGTYSEVPDAYRQKFSLSISDPAASDNLLYFSVPMPQIIGKRLTISYAPATNADETLIANYSGIYNTPAYLLNLKPQVRLEGAIIAEGSAVGFGSEQRLEFNFDTTIDSQSIENTIITGGYYAISLSTRYGGTRENILERTAELAKVAGMIDFNDPSTLDKKLGEILYISATDYHQNLDAITKKIATLHRVTDVRDVSEMMYFLTLKVDSIFGMPRKITPAGITGDMDRNLHTVVPFDGDMSRIKPFMQLMGNLSSFLEHDVTEKIYKTQAISAVKGIQLADDQGIPVHLINSQNINTELLRLQLSAEVKADIANAINAGQEVIVPERDMTLGSWIGVGYIVQDPVNGKAAYLISGGYGGAATIDSAATEDSLRATMTDFSNSLKHPTMPRQVRFPGPDNKMYTIDDVVYTEVSLLELDQDEYDVCSTWGDDGCEVRYRVSNAAFAQPLIDTEENGIDAKLSEHVMAGDWQSQDGAKYMRAGTAVLMTIEFLVGYFVMIKGGEKGTAQIVSGYRDYIHNLTIPGSSETSHHVDGIATDTEVKVTGTGINVDPKKCEVLQEAKVLAGGKGEILAEGAKSTVHGAVPAIRPHTDENKYADQWRCK